MGEEFIIDIANRFNQITGGSPEVDVNKRIFALTGGEFNMLDLFRKVFGYRGIPYGVGKAFEYKSNEAEAFANDAIETFSSKTSEYTSALGSPIFQPLKMTDPGDKDGKKIDPFLFPNEPLVTIQGAKKLLETTSAGGEQEVIEHISLGHYQIKIQGFCVNMESDDMPEEDMRRMRSYYELRRGVEINSPLLTLFGVKYFAFKGITWPSVEGCNAIQGYEITGRSYKPFQLVRKSNR